MSLEEELNTILTNFLVSLKTGCVFTLLSLTPLGCLLLTAQLRGKIRAPFLGKKQS